MSTVSLWTRMLNMVTIGLKLTKLQSEVTLFQNIISNFTWFYLTHRCLSVVWNIWSCLFLVSIIETCEITFLIRRKLIDCDVTSHLIALSSAAFKNIFLVALFFSLLPKLKKEKIRVPLWRLRTLCPLGEAKYCDFKCTRLREENQCRIIIKDCFQNDLQILGLFEMHMGGKF